MKKLFIGALAALALSITGTLATGTASAADFSPAIVFDMGGKFDKSFNRHFPDNLQFGANCRSSLPTMEGILLCGHPTVSIW